MDEEIRPDLNKGKMGVERTSDSLRLKLSPNSESN
jgi:hypothetical protein